MATPTYDVLVRERSAFGREQIQAVMRERAPVLRVHDGSIQKYSSCAGEGEFGGFSLRESLDAVQEHRASDLAATIASADHCIGEPQLDVVEIVMPLRG